MNCGGVINMYPLVIYAHKIGKNTQDLTAADMANFMKWWMKQPNRVEVEKQIVKQLGRAKQIHDKQHLERMEDKMAKKSTTRAFQDAQHSRLTPDQIEEVEFVEEGEEVVEEVVEEIDMEQELQVINDKIAENDIVCTMELTKGDVEALLFSISRTFEDYELRDGEENHPYAVSLESLKVGLEGV